jgi:hypothetical protein
MMKKLLILAACLAIGGGIAQAQGDPNAVRQQEDTPEGLLIIEAEGFDNQVVKDQSNWYLISDPGASRGQAMASEDSGINHNQDDYAEVSPRLDYDCVFVKSGTHYVWLRMRYFGGDADTAHLGLDGTGDPDSRRIDAPGSADGAWQWSNFKQNPDGTAMIQIPSAGEHTVNLWVREDGIQIDKIILTTDPNYVPSTYGPRDPLLGPAVALEPTDAVVATGDSGMVLSIAGIDASELVLGTTTFAGEPKHADFPPEAADNFDLGTGASADDQEWVQTIFDLPVTTVLIIEKGGNDSGYIVGLDENGEAIDDAAPFSPDDFADTGLTGVQNQKVAAAILTPEVPIYGIRVLPPDDKALGFDPTSVSGVPGAIITAGPIDSLDALTAADLDPDGGDPNTLVEVLAINGNDVGGLVLGTTSSDFEKWPEHPAPDADNFDLTTYASLDDSNVVEIVFDAPVTTVFIMERGANDKGYLQPIDAEGAPIGGALKFTQSDFQFQDEGLKIAGQNAGGMAIEAKMPINGLLIIPLEGGTLGIDPASVSAVPAPQITKAAVATLVADANAVATEINGIATADLIVGATVAHENVERADNADNFDLSEQDAGRAMDEAGDRRWVTTTFAQPVTQFFVLEMTNSSGNADDDGWVVPLDIDGNRIGGPLWYYPDDWSTFDIPGARNDRRVAGLVFTPETDVPVYGLLQWSDGVDVLSISAVPE